MTEANSPGLLLDACSKHAEEYLTQLKRQINTMLDDVYQDIAQREDEFERYKYDRHRRFQDEVRPLAAMRDELEKAILTVAPFQPVIMLEATDITFRIMRVINETAKIAYHRMLPSARIIEDLGADSLDYVEILMALEKEFGVHISDNLAIWTVSDLDRLVRERLTIK